MHTIAVVAQKGGTGKTTLATNVGAAAHMAGLRVLIVDLDPQGSAFDWYHARAEGSKLDGLAVIPGVRDGKREDEPLTRARYDELTRGYDVALFDCSRIGNVTLSALLYADTALIPVQTGPYDNWALEDTIRMLQQADVMRLDAGRLALRRLYVLNRAIVGTRLADEAERSLAEGETLGGKVAGVVYQRIVFQTSALEGESVFTVAAAEPAAADIERIWRAVKRQQKNGTAATTHAPQPPHSGRRGQVRGRVSRAAHDRDPGGHETASGHALR